MTEQNLFVEAMPYVIVALKIGLWVFGIVFVLNGANEVFFDVVKLWRDIWRRVVIFRLRKAKPLMEEDLLAKPEQPVAVMIPCWDESSVIRRMLDNSLQVLNYSKYVIFVGTYPNDPATQREVDLVREKYGNIERVVCPKDGPTSKADCLNWIYEGIRHYEKEHAVQFEVFVVEDSEDVLHPLTLKLFNYMMPRMDMVQLPVLPMEPRWYEFTRGTYVDEFAANHSRDMVVRELLSRNLPSAGVGTAFSRKLLERIYKEKEHRLFTIGSVTEDYDFGIRLAEMEGVKQIFARIKFIRTRRRKNPISGKEKLVATSDYIGIREFFPNNFWAAVRQKSRWVLGITLQAWETIGWVGGFWTRYMLLRDRISLLANQVIMLANVLVPIYLLVWGYIRFFPEAYRFPALVEANTALYYLLLINLGLLVWELFIRCYYVAVLYGPKQAMLSPLRLIWANIINYCATVRALKQYAVYLATGQPIAWDKTDHAYPSEQELVKFRRRLGDLLLDRRFVTVTQLDEALDRQKATGQTLGSVLVDMGYLGEEELLQVLGMQFSLQTTEVDPYAYDRETIGLIPEHLAFRYQVFPLGLSETGELLAASETLLSTQDLQALENELGRKVQLRLTTRGELSFALRRGYERLRSTEQETGLGERLVRVGLVSEGQLEEALKKQRRSYRRLGDVLVSNGFITQNQLTEILGQTQTRETALPLGEKLLKTRLITREQLDDALAEQHRHMPRIGDILVESGVLKREVLETMFRQEAAI